MASGTNTASPTQRTTTTLQRLRLAAGDSREVLAARAGLSARTIYAIELEGVQPQRATRRVLAEALGCEPEDLND
jgi:transcriptional regulator with XRE-family HTH domain